MLSILSIKDYALIENITVEFKKGFNIITGETGAGKSILVGALGLILGERASVESVRKGSNKAIVEGVFEIKENSEINKILEENNIDSQPELIIRREISSKGTNRCFLNDNPVPLSVIKSIGDLLVDLHGQHEHQSLLKQENHIQMLDNFGNYQKQLEEFNQLKILLNKSISELASLIQREKEIKEKKELYLFQIKEIDSINTYEEEEDELIAELKVLENSANIIDLTNSVYFELYESDFSVNNRFGEIKNKLEQLSEYDPKFSDKLEEAEQLFALLNDISEFTRSYRDSIEIDPSRLEEVRSRLSSLNLLKKKYGGSVKRVLEHRNKIGEEYEIAENFNENIIRLSSELDLLRNNAGNIAESIHNLRVLTSNEIKKGVEETLSYLGISNANFYIKIERLPKSDDNYYITYENNSYDYNNNGFDNVEFFISTNIGEDPKPLVKVASGGEVSRIMLSLKTILAKNDKLPLLIFDEIDTGVSGRVAQKVGKAMQNLSKHHQIISITHQAQIAALADHHFVVEKHESEGRVTSSIRLLSKEDQIREVAKLISGEKITEASLISAKELINY